MSAPKVLAVGTIAALSASLLVAPFKYVGHLGTINDSRPTSGTLFRPIFTPPKRLEIVFPAGVLTWVDHAELNTGALGLIWAGIIVGAVGIGALARPATSSTRRCPECAETIQAAATKCRFCGAVLTPAAHLSPTVSRIVCPKCSTHYETTLTGCNYCGAAKPAEPMYATDPA